jgi:hypothetical protein
VDLPELE